MKTRYKVLLFVLVGGGTAAGFLWTKSGPAIHQPGDIPLSEEERRLDEGEIMLTQLEPTGGEGVAVMAKAVIEAPVDKVWPTVRDCEHFKAFMPRVIESHRTPGEDGEFLCFAKIDMPWPVDDMEAETRSKTEELPGGVFRRSWTLSKGTFKHNNGSYEVAPFRGDTARTLLTYKVDVRPSVAIPDMVLKRAQSNTIPNIFVQIGERVGAPPRS